MSGFWDVIAGLLEARGAALDERPASELERLAPHQRAAVFEIEAALIDWGGVLLADAVGLGKTWVAVAIAVRAHRRGQSSVAFVPASLVEMWRDVARRFEVPLTVLGHDILARRTVDLSRIGDASLVIVDEAHRFRNAATRRYSGLARFVVGRSVLLLTATPVNNSPDDLRSLLSLFLDGAGEQRLGIESLEAAIGKVVDGGDAAWLGRVMIRRRRRDVVRFMSPSGRGFPRRKLASIDYSLDEVYGGQLAEHVRRLEEARRWLPVEEPGRDGWGALLALGWVRRLESSRAAFAMSLARQSRFFRRWVEAAHQGRRLTRASHRRWFRNERAQQGIFWEFLLGERLGEARPEVARAGRALEEWCGSIRTWDRDTKAEALIAQLRELPEGEPVVVFSEFRDTVVDLAQRLLEVPRRVARLDAREARLDGRPIDRQELLGRFAPRAQGRLVSPRERIDVLVTTDLLAEGTNLQDARHVVSYDLPWNPVRLEQRAGRVDRIGASHDSVCLWTLRPHEADLLAPILAALRRKRLAAIELLGIDAPVLDDEPSDAGPASRTPAPTLSITSGSALEWLRIEVVRRGARPACDCLAATGAPAQAMGELVCLQGVSGRPTLWSFYHRSSRQLWWEAERIADHLRRFGSSLRDAGAVDDRFARAVAHSRRAWPEMGSTAPSDSGPVPPARRRLIEQLERRLSEALRLERLGAVARLGSVLDRLSMRPMAGVELLLDDLEHRASSVTEDQLLRDLERWLPERPDTPETAPSPLLMGGLQIR